MSSKFLSALAFAGIMSLGGCVAHGRAAFVVEGPPPPPRHVVVSVRPGFIWVDGYWDRYGGDWRWRDGYYVRPRADHVYVQGHWVHGNGRRYRYEPGRWVRRDDHRTSARDTWRRGRGR